MLQAVQGPVPTPLATARPSRGGVTFHDAGPAHRMPQAAESVIQSLAPFTEYPLTLYAGRRLVFRFVWPQNAMFAVLCNGVWVAGKFELRIRHGRPPQGSPWPRRELPGAGGSPQLTRRTPFTSRLPEQAETTFDRWYYHAVAVFRGAAIAPIASIGGMWYLAIDCHAYCRVTLHLIDFVQ